METIKYSYRKPKRIRSVIKTKTEFNLNKTNSINNSARNNYNFSNLNHSKKIDLNRLETDYSIPSARLKLRFKEKPIVKNRIFSACKKNSKLFGEPQWKKSLRGKLRLLVKNNIILCEKKFHPRSFTESITHPQIKEFKNKFRNLDNRNKIGIFTNKFPSILNSGNKFYSRYFDNFISPDELLNKNFNKEEIFQIKSDPIYFNFGGNFQNVSFFKKNSLKQTLNEEEKIGQNNIIDFKLKKSLNQTKKKIGKYLNYYTSVMSRQGFI